MDTFERELEALLNRYSMENGSNTPDFILAEYLHRCLDNFNATIKRRGEWYGRMDVPAQGSVTYPFVSGGNGPAPIER